MAVIYDVNESREGRKLSFSGSGDQLSVTWHKNYQVQISDPVNPAFDPTEVSDFDILSADGLPIVNRTIFSSGGKIMPYVICRDKSGRRDKRPN